jgi:uncharacterized MAPEG superfamily protein
MSIELRLLAYSIALLFVLMAIQASAGVKAQGLITMMNNRDNLGPPTAYQARTKRLVDNMRENLWFFAPLVLIAALTNVSNDWTVLGARLFFYGRIAHAIIYLAGWPTIRPFAWTVAIVGCILIFLALFGILV